MEEWLEIRDCLDEGFHPVVSFDKWRVAYLNYTSVLEHDRLSYLERHLETDEVFVLLSGSAILWVARDDPKDIRAISMEPGCVYNVRLGVWHNIEMTLGTRVLLMENADTSEKNAEFFYFHKGFLQEIGEKRKEEIYI